MGYTGQTEKHNGSKEMHPSPRIGLIVQSKKSQKTRKDYQQRRDSEMMETVHQFHQKLTEKESEKARTKCQCFGGMQSASPGARTHSRAAAATSLEWNSGKRPVGERSSRSTSTRLVFVSREASSCGQSRSDTRRGNSRRYLQPTTCHQVNRV